MFIASNTKSKVFFAVFRHPQTRGVGSIFRGSPLVGWRIHWGHGLLMNITLGPNEVSALVDMATGMLTAKEADYG